MEMRCMEIMKRSLILPVLALALLATLAGCVGAQPEVTPAEEATATPTQSVQAATSTPEPLVREVTIPEISRYPTDMPDSANYTLYEDGQYQNPVERTGPLTIEAHFQIKEGVAEVVKGTTLSAWTFNAAIPGPMIRGQAGDTIDFYLQNPEDSRLPHNVDFHAATGPGGGSVRLVTAPGATSNLRIKLLKPGVYIYHCAFPDIPMHIAQGMYGLVVVEPEEGLPTVDQEYYIMQSEFYTVAGGESNYQGLQNQGFLEYSNKYGNLEEPTFISFNGRPEAVTGDRALGVFGGGEIKTGETVRLFVGNIGPNLISSFHTIGEIFDKVYVEGSFSLVNENVQTTLVPSGGAVGVEMTFEVPGDYLMVDHSIFRMHKGAVGIIRVTGPENPEVYDPVE
jgi:nitrite reductase (NO-forming)